MRQPHLPAATPGGYTVPMRMPSSSSIAAVAAALAGCAAPTSVDAGSTAVVLGRIDTVRSSALGEERRLNVWLPPGYDAGTARYPVIYLLDGGVDEDYHHITGLVQFLSLYERMPPSIVIGIANVDRYRDFTLPSGVADDRRRLPTSGGAGAFLRFVADELQPHVDATWRTDGHRTLIGQSMGGLFAAQVLVERPELFDDWFLCSPSLWWDDESLLRRAEAGLPGDLAGRRVFVAVGAREEPQMLADADRFAAALRARAPAAAVGNEVLAGETHATVLHRAAYRAFEFFWLATHPGM